MHIERANQYIVHHVPKLNFYNRIFLLIFCDLLIDENYLPEQTRISVRVRDLLQKAEVVSIFVFFTYIFLRLTLEDLMYSHSLIIL